MSQINTPIDSKSRSEPRLEHSRNYLLGYGLMYALSCRALRIPLWIARQSRETPLRSDKSIFTTACRPLFLYESRALQSTNKFIASYPHRGLQFSKITYLAYFMDHLYNSLKSLIHPRHLTYLPPRLEASHTRRQRTV